MTNDEIALQNKAIFDAATTQSSKSLENEINQNFTLPVIKPEKKRGYKTTNYKSIGCTEEVWIFNQLNP